MEIWKGIKGFEGIYEVSNHGRVRSFKNKLKPRILSEFKVSKAGYWAVSVPTKKAKHTYVHRLVAEAFVPKSAGKHEVNHKDGNKKNNHYTNLEWCTRSENLKHAYQNGLMYQPRKKVKIFLGDEIIIAKSQIEAGLLLGGSRSTIAVLKNQGYNTYKGIKFEVME